MQLSEAEVCVHFTERSVRIESVAGVVPADGEDGAWTTPPDGGLDC